MRWIPVTKESECPPNDDWEDFPQHYILRCKNDGGRGHFDAYNAIASNIWTIASQYDYAEYLDESPSSDPAEVLVKALQAITDTYKRHDQTVGINVMTARTCNDLATYALEQYEQLKQQ